MDLFKFNEATEEMMEGVALSIMNWFYEEGEDIALRKLNVWLGKNEKAFRHLATALRDKGIRK